MAMLEIADYWNHNVHYQPVILAAVPPGCRTALDVGCGDGMLACKLASRCEAVTGIDRDASMITAARERAAQPRTGPRSAGISALAAGDGRSAGVVRFIEGDFLSYPFEDASFDFACANTALHHMDFGAALAKMARILRPGGRLAVVGLGASGSPADWVIGGAGIPANLYYKYARGEGDPGAPVLMPEMTWARARDTARRVLPGVRYRRHLLWRYSLTWTRPAQRLAVLVPGDVGGGAAGDAEQFRV
jgi:ubiquinone/menaquinone biosynthesis C-methylase UbiE